MDIVRLGVSDVPLARETLELMAAVLEDDGRAPLTDAYLTRLLELPDLWAYAALDENRPVGGLTAHVLPMTRAEARELLVYDIAVDTADQRRGIGRALIGRLLKDGAEAGISEVWIPASDDDPHALDFYRRIGGEAEAVTVFTYSTSDAPS